VPPEVVALAARERRLSSSNSPRDPKVARVPGFSA
jgi:hypothetical protein